MHGYQRKTPIVIKRIKKVAGGHHGGAWKIAYADFVTAMMAFFLLMWLLGSTSPRAISRALPSISSRRSKVSHVRRLGRGESKSIIKGGGQDSTRSNGQVRKGEIRAGEEDRDQPAGRPCTSRSPGNGAPEGAQGATSRRRSTPTRKLRQFKNQIRLDLTAEGLRIQIVDEQNRPMFDSGSAQAQGLYRENPARNRPCCWTMSNKVSLSGHTDATPYPGGERGGYSNWELSADRANAARRELMAGGMEEGKIVRVVGLASAVLFNKIDPLDPINRRISIIVMNKQAEEEARNDGGTVEVDADKSECPSSPS